MTDITLTAEELKARFPSDNYIQTRDDSVLQATIDAVITETNGYVGILDDATRLHAIALYAAHTVRLESITESAIGTYGMPTGIKSKDEEISYGTGEQLLDLTATLYGQRLQKLLDSQYAGGLLI